MIKILTALPLSDGIYTKRDAFYAIKNAVTHVAQDFFIYDDATGELLQVAKEGELLIDDTALEQLK